MGVSQKYLSILPLIDQSEGVEGFPSSDCREGAVFSGLISGGSRGSRLRENAEGAGVPRR